jgi:flagellin
MASVDVTRVAGNIGALNALNSLSYVNNQLALHQNRLATGKRINSASEDPAGMNLATTFDVRRQGLQVALNSIGDSKNMLSTAEGGLEKIQEILVTMKNKAMEAIGDTIGSSERQAIASQLTDYANEINNIVTQTQWNGTALISGSTGYGKANLQFLIDASGGSVGFSFTNDSNGGFGLAGIGLNTGSTATGGVARVATGGSVANTVANEISSALDRVKQGVREVGSFMARLTFKEDSLSIQYTNTEAAYNRIMNADMASEQVEASKFSILQQTATAMLSQANVAPQFILQLFQ